MYDNEVPFPKGDTMMMSTTKTEIPSSTSLQGELIGYRHTGRVVILTDQTEVHLLHQDS